MKLYVTLTSEEIEAAEFHGRKQHSKSYYKDGDVSNHIIGKMAEYAYAKKTGQVVNNEFFKYNGDGGIDFPDGTQVKCRDWPYDNVEMPLDTKSLNNANVNNYKLFYISKKEYKKGEVYIRGEVSKKTVELKKSKSKFKDKKTGNYKETMLLKNFDIKY
jgi:hypothetical protein